MDNNQPGMQNAQQAVSGQKHMKPFWPVFIIIVVSLIAGGVIMYYVSDTERQEEINSLFIMRRKAAAPAPSPTPTQAIDDAQMMKK